MFNWGMHFVSRQFMAPFNEFMLAMTLAGLRPVRPIHGRNSTLPEGSRPRSIERLSIFQSIANYVSNKTGLGKEVGG